MKNTTRMSCSPVPMVTWLVRYHHSILESCRNCCVFIEIVFLYLALSARDSKVKHLLPLFEFLAPW